MLRIKSNSSESNRNNMKKCIITVVFLFIGLTGFCQSASNEKSVSANVSLNKKMSFKVLNAYQNNSKTKVIDVFNYFQMLTDAQLSDDLKKEVVKSINQFFNDTNTLVIDFTSESQDKIPLQQFLQKLLISEPILFTVSNQAQYDAVTYNSWNTSYTVTRTKSGVTSKIKVNQTMYMFDETKQFGTSSKNVQSTYLGGMR